MKSLPWQVALVVSLTLLAAILRLSHLGLVNLYHDEYYQFETAVGYITTGQFARYDFYTQEIGATYTRAWPFTFQVAVSLKLFGITEAAARLPAALWGIGLIPLAILAVWWLTQKPLLAYTTGLILTFDDFMIGLSRYVRMYTIVIVLALIIATALYKFFETGKRQRWWYLLVAILASLGGYTIFKELTLALLGAIALYMLIRAATFVFFRKPVDRPWAVGTAVGFGLLIIAIVLQQLGLNIYPTDAIIIRSEPHWTYVQELFWQWRVPLLGYGFFLIGVVSQRRQWRNGIVYAACLSLVALSYFVFFSHRWEAQRYISFIVPCVTLVTAAGYITTARFLWALLPNYRWLRLTVIVSFVFLAGPWLSFPGLPYDAFLIRPAVADRTAAALGYADIRTAYHYVIEHYKPGEVVLIQTPRFYYWTDRSIPVQKLGGYQRLTFTEFKELARTGATGGWMIVDYAHQRHLRDKIKRYSDNRFTDIYQLESSLVHVYHFTPDDLRERRRKKK